MKIHFIGLGGIGVSALARYYLEKGYKVSGSDLVSSEITDALKEKGSKLLIGKHSPKNLPKDVDLVIYSPAVKPNNPELLKAKRLKSKIQYPTSNIQIQSYPEALGELTKKYFTIAVCGSHGKSTVAAMIGLLLTKAGFDPTVIVGTKLKEFSDSNFRMGHSTFRVVPRLVPRGSAILVIEADEHFASFLNYWPKIIVLTNLEPDHLDFYKNFKNYVSAFKKFISHLPPTPIDRCGGLPKNGFLVANKDDKNVLNTFSTAVKNVLWYSLKEKESEKIKKILKVPGEFNVSNALAALTAARALKIPDKISFKALSEYKGSWRRFEIKKIKCNEERPRYITLISDYAHHPTQIKVTLRAAREKFPRPPKFSGRKFRRARKKIWCIFQPHQYQRTYYLWNDFVKVFSSAPVDKIIITDIYDVAGREVPKIKKVVSSKKLVQEINKKIGHNQVTTVSQLCPVMYIPNSKEVGRYLKENLKSGEVVIIMGAGDIYRLSEGIGNR